MNHLVAIYEYIGKDSSLYAKRTIDRLTRRSETIAAFPYAGRAVPEYHATDIREVIEKPYRIIYRMKRDQIDILAVIHGTQLLPPPKL